MQADDQIAALRVRIADLLSERDDLAKFKLSRGDLRAPIKDYVSALDDDFAERVRQRFLRVALGDGDITSILSVRVAADGTINFAPILAAAMGETKLTNALHALTSAVPEGLSVDQRAAAIARIDAEVDGLCRSEELQIRELESSGHEVIRRADAPPAVVLAFTHELEA